MEFQFQLIYRVHMGFIFNGIENTIICMEFQYQLSYRIQ